MRKIIAIILYYMGILIHKNRMRILSLYFHNPSPEAFERIVKWAIKKNYTFIDRKTFLDWVSGKRQLESKAVYFSFDDGWKGNMKLIPVIEKYNVPITIFIPVFPLSEGNYWWEYVLKEYGSYKKVNEVKTWCYDDFLAEIERIKSYMKIERSAMTMEELKAINKHPLIDIQSHSYTHLILTKLPIEVLVKELHNSKFYLEKLLEKKIDSFSYPNGSFTDREITAVGKYYDYAFTTEQTYPVIGDSLLTIPRIAQTNDYWSNLAKIAGTWEWIKK